MKIIRTHEANPDTLTAWEKDQVYNGLDCCVTLEAFNAMVGQLDKVTRRTYEFSKALQGPVLEMRCRGIKIDQSKKADIIEDFMEKVDRLERQLERLAFEGLGMEKFNWRASGDVQSMFYDFLDLPPVRKHGRPTADASAREHLWNYQIARPFLSHLNMLADLGKKISVLKTGIDPDGRIRTSYNIAGTNTGRFSSSLSEFGTGGNLQNIEEALRGVLIADGGWKFGKFDAKSGESFCVGAVEWNLFRDDRYLEACNSGDPHTAVARLVWPTLGWTGDPSKDRDIADQPFYRHHSYRFMCKKIGHGSNYGGQPDTIAEQTRIPVSAIAQFQPVYFQAFPAHKKWHIHVQESLRKFGHLTTLTGRRRWFFKRRNDPKTFREALAYDPQGSLADIVNKALLKLWHMNVCPVVMHDHDALTFMYREKDEAKIVPLLMEQLIVPIPLAEGRTLRIPYDCRTGWNKGEYSKDNPNGLKNWTGRDERRREKEIDIMDRIVYRTNRRLRSASNMA